MKRGPYWRIHYRYGLIQQVTDLMRERKVRMRAEQRELDQFWPAVARHVTAEGVNLMIVSNRDARNTRHPMHTVNPGKCCLHRRLQLAFAWR